MASKSRSQKNPASYHHGDLRNALLKAAISLIKQEGPNALSLRAVAKQAGVSHTAPYRHFEDKHALLEAIAHDGFRALSLAMQDAAKNYPDPLEQIVQAGEAYIELATRNPEVTQIMFGGYIEPDRCSEAFSDIAEQAFQGLLTIIENGKNAGVLKQEDSELLAMATWSLAHGFAMLVAGGQVQHRVNNPDEVKSMSRILGSLLLNGIREKGGG